jgi:hypothetical protein
MSSPETPEIDLERDMPLTSADLEALARARVPRELPTDEYLHWLSLMSRTGLVLEKHSHSDEPFTL